MFRWRKKSKDIDDSLEQIPKLEFKPESQSEENEEAGKTDEYHTYGDMEMTPETEEENQRGVDVEQEDIEEDTEVNIEDTKVKIEDTEVKIEDTEVKIEDTDDEKELTLLEDGEYYQIAEEKKTSKKKIVFIVGIGFVCLAGIITFIIKNINGGDDGKVYVESVGVVTGMEPAYGSSNRYTGEVEAQDSWKITLDADMSVEKCHVKVGDQVKKGQKLFTYNTEELKLNRDKKQLELDTVNNEITQLTKDIASYQADLKNADTTEKIELQTQILTAQTTIKKDEYSVKALKEEIEKIKKNINDATVSSKMDGVVKSINETTGTSSDSEEAFDETVGGEDSVYMTILSIGDYRIKGKISETNISSISEGDPVIVRSRTEETTWNGTIQSIKTDSTADENESTDAWNSYYDEGSGGESASNYYFYVELQDDTGLLMGQHVFVESDYGQDETKDGIWISSAYIMVDGEEYYAWVDNGRDRLEKRTLKVGEYDEILDEYQVLSGISTEDYIACNDEGLKEGMKTTKVDPAIDDTLDSSEEEGLYDEFEEDMSDEFEDGYDEDGMYEEEPVEDVPADEIYDDSFDTDGDSVGIEGDVIQ